MFFGVADMMGHPWEQLIEHFQKKAKPGTLAHVRDYAAKFAAMLDNLEEFFPRERQKDDYKRLLASVYRYVFHLAQYLARDRRQRNAPTSPTRRSFEEAIEHVWKIYQFREDGSPRRDLACFPQGFAATVARDYADVIDELIAYGFSPSTSTKTAHAASARHRALLRGQGSVPGGRDRAWCSRASAPMSAIPSSSPISSRPSSAESSSAPRSSVDAIDSEMRSKIRVFADSEVTNAFIRGIDLNLERRFYGTVQAMMHGLVDHVRRRLPECRSGAARRRAEAVPGPDSAASTSTPSAP